MQLFPRFLGVPLRHADRAVWGTIAIALALLARFVGQPMTPGRDRAAVLVFAALALPVGAVVAGSAFHGLSRASLQPSGAGARAWRRFVAVGGLALGCALVLFVWAGLDLATGYVLVPQGLDEALIHLELAGFATCLVFAVSSRVFGRFLLLRTRPLLEPWLPGLAMGWGTGLLLVALGWLLEVQAAGVWVRWLGSLVELADLKAEAER